MTENKRLEAGKLESIRVKVDDEDDPVQVQISEPMAQVRRGSAMSEPQLRDNIALREYVDMRINALEKLITLQMNASEVAINKAETAVTYRLESLNEFRQSLVDQTRNYTTRNELESLRSAHEAELKSLSKQVYILVGAMAALQAIFEFLVK